MSVRRFWTAKLYNQFMLALYLFCAGLGIPLLAMFALGGNDGDVDIGDAGFDLDTGLDADVGMDLDVGGGFGVGDLSALVRRIPISSYAFFLAVFGGVGCVGTWLNFGFATTLVLAVCLGLVGSFVNTALFAFVRGTTASSHLEDRDLEGRLATVSIPIEDGRRGRVWLESGDERVQLTASLVDGIDNAVLNVGEQVLIVGLEQGVAQVMRTDRQLES